MSIGSRPAMPMAGVQRAVAHYWSFKTKYMAGRNNLCSFSSVLDVDPR